MHVRWSVLDVSLLACNELFYISGCFIVQFVQLGFETLLLAEGVHLGVCSEQLLLVPAFDWNALDVVGIVNVKDADIFHSSVADAREHACLVAAYEATRINS